MRSDIKSLRMKYKVKSSPQENRNVLWMAIRDNINDYDARMILSDLLEEDGDTDGANIHRLLATLSRQGILAEDYSSHEEFELVYAITGPWVPVDMFSIVYDWNSIYLVAFYQIIRNRSTPDPEEWRLVWGGDRDVYRYEILG